MSIFPGSTRRKIDEKHNKISCFVTSAIIINDLYNIVFLIETSQLTRQANQVTRLSSFRRHDKNVIALDQIIPCQYLLQRCNMNP